MEKFAMIIEKLQILDLSILFEIFLGCCGLEHWRTLLRESKEVDKLRNIEKKHAILEESEQTGQVNFQRKETTISSFFDYWIGIG